MDICALARREHCMQRALNSEWWTAMYMSKTLVVKYSLLYSSMDWITEFKYIRRICKRNMLRNKYKKNYIQLQGEWWYRKAIHASLGQCRPYTRSLMAHYERNYYTIDYISARIYTTIRNAKDLRYTLWAMRQLVCRVIWPLVKLYSMFCLLYNDDKRVCALDIFIVWNGLNGNRTDGR